MVSTFVLDNKTARGFKSDPQKSNPKYFASNAVVPLPTKGSNTVLIDLIDIIFLIKSLTISGTALAGYVCKFPVEEKNEAYLFSPS